MNRKLNGERQLLDILIRLKADHKFDARTVAKLDEAIEILRRGDVGAEQNARLLRAISFVLEQLPKFAALLKMFSE